MRKNPTASIIISAYNRPKVVSYAIRSVLASDFDDWELIIVGDGCNAETEDAIKAFADPRIKFHNLPENTGHQSAPHNKGVELARGEFVLFLNQDDMYFPDHISKRIDFMQKTGADISWSPILLLQHSSSDSGPFDPENDLLVLDGTVSNDKFHPKSFVISSCWAVRREVCDQVGPWLEIEKTRLSPSQEWLFRAHRQKRKLAYHREVSVLCIHSGVRRYSYLNSESPEHQRAWDWICGGAEVRVQLLNKVAVQMAGEAVGSKRELEKYHHPIWSTLEAVSGWFGVHPDSVRRYFTGMTKGSTVNNHTKFTKGAAPVLSPGQLISFDGRNGKDLLGRGWHKPESGGRWSSQESAELVLTITEANQILEISGHPLREHDDVEILVNGKSVLTKSFTDQEQPLLVPVASAGHTIVTFIVRNPTSPQELGKSKNSKVLGFHIGWLKLAV
jgi:glycosyltransferase involved in cell wall biosynthesis